MAPNRIERSKPRHRATGKPRRSTPAATVVGWTVTAGAPPSVPVLGCAHYIGRVGALAVALGVGAAMATGFGVGTVRADDTSTTDNASVDTPSDPSAEPPDEPTSEPAATAGGSDNAGSDDREDGTSDTGMQADSSGGQDTSVNDQGQSTDAAGDESTGEESDGEDAGEGELEEVEPDADSRPVEPAPKPESAAPAANHDSPTAADPPAVRSPAPLSLTLSTVSSDPAEKSSAPVIEVSGPVGAQYFATVSTTAPEPEPLVASAVPEPGPGAPAAITRITTVLSPLFAPGPGSPVDPPLVLGLLGWVRNQEQRRYDAEGASLAVTAALVNSAPTARNNSATTAEDTAVTINVLSNDSDPDGDSLTPVVVTNPANGIVTTNPNGSLTYTPNANFNGTDTFTYSASDGTSSSTPATVTVRVTAVNDAPVAVNDTATTTEDTSVVINVKANDTDVENNTLTPQVLVHPVNGKVVRNADGTYTYTPKANFHGTDTFTYRLYDGKTSNAATVTITVNSVNDVPTAGGDSATTSEDTPVTINVLANDKDGDGQTLTPAVVAGPANGNVTVNPNGTFTYTPNLNFNGNDTFTYAASDGIANSTPATVTVRVAAVNDAPIAKPDFASTLVNTSVVIAVKDNDVDPDDTNLIASVTTHPANGKVVRNSDGTYTYTPKANFIGTDTFSYRLYDGSATSAPTTVTVTVRPPNQPPAANSDSATVAEDSTTNIAVLTNDIDNDGNSGINPASVTITQQAVNGTATANPDGTVSYTPHANFNGADTFRYTVADTAGAVSGAATVSITVTAVNDAPVAVDDVVSTTEDTPVTITPDQLLDNDSDVEGDTLTAVLPIGSGPANGQLVTGPGDSLTYIPNPGFSGTDTFVYRATDGAATSNAATVTVTVTAIEPASVVGSVDIPDAVLGVGPVFGPDGRALVTVKELDPDTGQVVSTELVVVDTVTGERVNGLVHVTRRQMDGDLVGPIEFNADHTRAYLTTQTIGDRTQFGVLDLSTGELIAVPVDLAGSPSQTVFTEDGTRAWIITDDTAGGTQPGEPERHATTIALVDLGTGALVNPAITRNDTAPGFGPLFTPDGSRVLFTLHGTDLDTGEVTTTFPVVFDATSGVPISDADPPILHRLDGATADVEFNADYSRAYLTTRTIGDRTQFGVLDMASGELIARAVEINGAPAGLVFTDDHTRVWVITDDTAGSTPERHAARLALVDTTTGLLVGTPIVRNDAAPRLDPLITPDGSLALITINGLDPDTGVVVDTDVYLVDLTTGALRGAETPITLEGSLVHVEYSEDNTRAYLTTVGADNTYFSVVNLSTGAQIGEAIEIDGSPISDTAINITFTDDNTQAWIITDDVAGGNGPTNPERHRFILTIINTGEQAEALQATRLAQTEEAQSFSLMAALANTPPVAVKEAAFVQEDTPATLNVLANDKDADGDPLIAQLVTGPANGNVTVNVDQTVTYTPNANFNGPDSFTYSAFDGTDASAPVTVSLNVRPVNDAPVAVPDSATTTEDTPVVIAIKANDTDVENNPLTPQILTQPANGKVVRNIDGTFTYTPKVNFTGTDTFTYRLYDGKTSNPATVTVTVNAVNDVPVAVKEAAFVQEDTPATLNVLANDKDGDGDALTAQIVTGPANGSVLVNPNGSVTYTPNANFNGPDSFTYSAFDGIAASAPATVSLNVRPVNDAPVANDDAASTLVNTPVVIAIKANDTDVENNPLTPQIMTQPANGKVVRNITGTFTYTPNPNFVGTDTFTYRLYDGKTSNTATVTVTVAAIGGTIEADDDAYTALAGVPFEAPFSVRDNDISQTGNPLGEVTLVDPPQFATAFSLDADGGFTYTTNPDFTGTDTFTYQVTDSIHPGAVSNIATVTITVVSPITADGDAYTVLAGVPFEAPFSVRDNDVSQTGNPLGEVTLVDPPQFATSFSLDADGGFTYTTNPDFTGTDTFTYRVADSVNPGAVSAPATVTITVVSPIEADDDAYTVLAGVPFEASVPVTANDSSQTGNPLGQVTLVDGPDRATAFSLDADGGFTYTTNPDFTGTDTFTYQVADSIHPGAVSNIATVTITVSSGADELMQGATTEIGGVPKRLAVSPDGTRAYVIDESDNSLVVVDLTEPPASFASLRAMVTAAATPLRIPLSGFPTELVVSPDGTRVYVGSIFNGTVTVVDAVTNTVIDANPGVGGVDPISLGHVPGGMAISPDGGRLFVTNADGASVTVINTVTNQIIDTDPDQPGINPIALINGNGTLVPIAVGRDKAYVITGDTLQVLDTATYEVIAGPIAVEPLSVELALTRDESRLYVVTASRQALTVIDTATLQAVDTDPNHAGINPILVAENPIEVALRGDRAYVLSGSGVVTVVNTVTNTVVDTINIGHGTDIAVSPSGTRIYVTRFISGTFAGEVLELTNSHIDFTAPVVGDPPFTVDSINTVSGVVTGSVNVIDPDGDPLNYKLVGLPEPAIGTATVNAATGEWTFSPTAQARLEAYAGGASTATFTISAADGQVGVPVAVTSPIDPIEIAITGLIHLENPPVGVAVTPDGSRAYVVDPGPYDDGGRVQVIDTATGEVLEDEAITVGFSPFDIAITPNGATAYVTHTSDTTVSVVDVATGTVVDTIQVDFGAYRVIFSPDGAHAYVSSTSGSVAIIDTATHTVEATIPITNTASGLGIYGGYLYVGNQEFPNAQLTVIDLADNNAPVDEIVLVDDDHLVPQMMAVIGNRGYVPLPGAGVVWVVNLDTNQLVDTNDTLAGINPISLADGDFPTGIAAHGDRVYVTGAFSQTLTVIDTTTNTVVETIPLPFTPVGAVGVSPDGSKIYVTAGDYSNLEDYDGIVIVLTSARSSAV